jgi:hypothetical protein
MRLLRVLGWLLMAAAASALAYDLAGWSGAEALRLSALGELWFKLDRASLNLAQAVVQRYVWPQLWDPGIVTVLLLPAVLVFAVPGGAMLGLSLIGRGEHRRRRRKRGEGGLRD